MLTCGLIVLLAGLPPAACAEPAPAPLQPPPSAVIRFEHISIEQGLSQSTVRAILQDSRGFMWFGTDDGLNRYDGYQFTIFRHDPDDPTSLSQGGVQEIHEDRAGSLWVLTSSGGLDRLDRDHNRFVRYRRDDGGLGTLEEDFVWDFYEDRSGAIWAGTYLSGLFRYDRDADRFVRFHHDPANPTSLSDDRVYTIYEDSKGLLWIGTARGLDRFDTQSGSFVHFRHDPSDPTTLSGERVQLIHEDRAGRLWIATYGSGLNLFDRSSGSVTRYVHDPQSPQSIDETTRILELYEDSRGYLWVHHSDGRLDRFDPDQGLFKRFRHDPAEPDTPAASTSLGHETVSFIKEDRNGNLWVGTFGGGLDRFDPDQEQLVHYRHAPYDPASLSDNQLLSFCEDRAGGLWIGTFGHGLNRFDPAQFRFPHYRIDPQAADAAENNVVLDVRLGSAAARSAQPGADSAGLVWVGSSAGLSSLDRTTGQVTRYRHDPHDSSSLSAGRVWSVFEDGEGSLWVGTETGLDRLDPVTGTFTHFKDASEEADAAYGLITAITDDGAGGLWLGVYGRGLEHFDPTQATFQHYEYHLAKVQASLALYHEVWVVYRAHDGWIWIGTTRGLYGLDPVTGAAVHYIHDPQNPGSPSSNEIHAILEDRAGRLWIGTWGGGLNQLDRATGQFLRYTVKDGLPNNTIYCILEDPDSRLWLSTNNGLSRFDPTTSAFRNYDSGDGLQSNEFNTGSCSITPQGEMFFGGVNGFNAFFPEQVQDSSIVPPVVLTALTRPGGEPLPIDRAVENLSELTLQWPADSFEFEFAGLSYSQPEKNQYAYMLAPFEKDWTHVGNRRYGSYTNLPGGTYTLRLKAANSAGVWNEEGVSLKITVIPPFWETWMFRAALILALVSLAGGAVRWRITSIENRSRKLAVEVAERTLTIAAQTADLEALYQADGELERHVQLDPVLQALVDIAVEQLHADRSAVLAWDDRHERLVIRVARHFSARAIEQISFGPGEGFVGQAMATGEPVIVVDAEADLRPEGGQSRRVRERTEVIEAVLGEGIRSFMHIPILVDGAVFGVFNVCYDEVRAFGEREQRLFTALAQRAALAVRNAQHFAAEQRRTEQFRVIGEVGRGLASILDIDELLGEIVRLIQGAFGYDHVGLALIEGDEAIYRVGAGKLWDDPSFMFAPSRLKVGSEGITGWVAASGEPLLAPDVSQEPRYVWMRGSHTRSELTVPLKVAGKVIGVLDAQSDRLNAFDDSDLTVMQSLANQAAISIENARLYEEVQRVAASQERSRLARDLHDAVTQTLFSASLIAEVLPGLWESDPREGHQLLGELRQLTRGALAEMRTLLLELRPAALIEANLGDLLRQLAESVSGRTGIPVTVSLEGCPLPDLPDEVHVALYRIAQEALNNVVKHAHAQQAEVKLWCSRESKNVDVAAGGDVTEDAVKVAEPEGLREAARESAVRVVLTISDNGRGFDPAAVSSDHLGLGIIHERSQAIGAALRIASRPGQGTVVEVNWTPSLKE